METIKDVKEHSSSQSFDSSEEEVSVDSEVLKIKKITADLSLECKENLKKLKKVHKIFTSQTEELAKQMNNLTEKKKFITPINNLKEKTCEINQILVKSLQNTKKISDDDHFSLNDGNFHEIFTKLQFGIESVNEKFELSQKVIEKCTETTSANQTFKENNAKLENESKNEACSCVLL
jgi:diphthamide synthase subunit DPH2